MAGNFGNGLSSSDANGGSIISKITPPAPSTDYDVETGFKIWLTDPTATVYVQYLRASNDALSGPVPSGSYYAVELQSPTFEGPTVKYGTATLAVYKRISGVITQLGSTTVPVAKFEEPAGDDNGTVMRSVIRGQLLLVYINGVQYFSLTDSSLASGMPGVGIRSGSYINPVNLGPIDLVAPPAMSPQMFSTSEFPTYIDFQWRAAPDDRRGVGPGVRGN